MSGVWLVDRPAGDTHVLQFWPRSAAHTHVTLVADERLSAEQWRLIAAQFNNLGLKPLKYVDDT